MKQALLLCAPFLALSSSAQYYCNDFDGSCFGELLPMVIDTTADSLWSIGSPDKVFFQEANSPVNVIVTDTAVPYPTSTMSRFIVKLPMGEAQWWPEFFVHFVQTFDMDSAHAGGYIEVSYDSAQTWMNVFEDWVNPPNTEFWENGVGTIEPSVLSNGQLGFTGTSGGPVTGPNWVWSSLCWVQTGVPLPDTLHLRFTFYSDSLAYPRDGWMLDDFEFQVYIAHPISEYLKMDHYFVAAPNPMSDRLFVNYDTYGPSTPVHIDLFDQQGRLVRTLGDGNVPEGKHNFILWRRDLPEALTVAFLKATIGDRSYTEKVLLVR